jgi:DGQHR domain-containing protein
VFDGKQEDFAAEMFVIINSTHTRINKSHLVDLMEKVTYGTSPEKKWAAWIVTRLYEDDRSPLQYKINKLGGRSKQEKWVLQSELYNEVYRLVDPRRDKPNPKETNDSVSIHRYIATDFGWDRRGPAADLFIDYFKAIQETMKDVWGNKNSMFTTSVTIKALVRAFGNILSYPAVRKTWREKKSPDALKPFIEGWKDMAVEFRKEGFYERFAARGQVERVRKIHNELARRL